MRLRHLPLLSLLSLSFLSGAVLAGPTVVGSGQVATETRAVAGFDAIALRGSITLVLRQGGREGLELSADDNLLPLVETRVVGRTLEIGPVSGTGWRSRNDIRVTVDLLQLRSISLSGSGDVVAEALKTGTLKVVLEGSGDVRLRRLAADEVSVRLAGSGDVALDGRAGKLAIAIAGSGDVDAARLETDDASVSVVGSGDADVNAGRSLAITIAGSGDVRYRGDASVQVAVAGSGSVRRR